LHKDFPKGKNTFCNAEIREGRLHILSAEVLQYMDQEGVKRVEFTAKI
jgi:hypothetical protein